MKTTAHIQTQQAQRITKRLANHWKHKFSVDETEDNFWIHFPAAQVKLEPQPNHLTVMIQHSDDSADLSQLEEVVLAHLIRMGQEDLSADWQR